LSNGPDTDALEKRGKRKAKLFFFSSLMGSDETFAQTFTGPSRLQAHRLVVNAHVSDVLSIIRDGTRIIATGPFHDVVPNRDAEIPASLA